jgi:hypothetical protein
MLAELPTSAIKPDAEDTEAKRFIAEKKVAEELFTTQDISRLRRGLVKLAVHVASLDKPPDLYVFPDTSARVLIDLSRPVLERLQQNGQPPRMRSLATNYPRAQYLYEKEESRLLKEYPTIYEIRTEEEIHQEYLADVYRNLLLHRQQDANRMQSFAHELDQELPVSSILIVDEYSGRFQSTMRYLLAWLRNGFPGARVGGFSFLGQTAVNRPDHVVPLVDVFDKTVESGDPLLATRTGITTPGFSYRDTQAKKQEITGVKKLGHDELSPELLEGDAFALPSVTRSVTTDSVARIMKALGEEVVDQLRAEGFFSSTTVDSTSI